MRDVSSFSLHQYPNVESNKWKTGASIDICNGFRLIFSRIKETYSLHRAGRNRKPFKEKTSTPICGG
jgi:hypothetical protein